MRRIYILLLTMMMLLVTAVAQAAQVSDAKWGINKDNVLRLVVDVTDSAGYAVSLRNDSLFLTVNADLLTTVPKTRKINSSLADVMYITSAGRSTVLRLPLKKTVTDKDYKAFVLRKDAKNNRPFRVVLDITADKKLNSVAVSNRPIKTTRGVNTDMVKASAKAGSKNKKTSTTSGSKVVLASSSGSSNSKVKVIRATKPYRTSGGLAGKIITLDAGHGGSDPGAIGAKGVREKNITLPITENLKAILEKKGATVYMTRSTDKDVAYVGASDAEELQARVNVAQKYNSDLFVSIHINSAANKTVGGIASYYYPKTVYDSKIARCIQKELAAGFGVDNRGIQEANFYVIKRSSMPATLLELCFISNPKEETLISSDWFQNKAAKVIAEGIENYFS